MRIVNSIAFQKVDKRLEDLLESRSVASKQKELHVTHKQLADELGTAREVVSRLLKQMEREGKLELGRNRITLGFSNPGHQPTCPALLLLSLKQRKMYLEDLLKEDVAIIDVRTPMEFMGAMWPVPSTFPE